jgi:transmembrane sensor
MRDARADVMDTQTDVRSADQRALEWVKVLPRANAQMREAFAQWVLDSPEHLKAFLRHKVLTTELQGLDPDHRIDIESCPGANLGAHFGRPPRPAEPNAHGRLSARLATGAAVALVLYLSGLAVCSFTTPAGWISYTTTIGGYEHVILADGSTIRLNTDTEIRARLAPDEREIRLVRGEAFIKVAAGDRRPFVGTGAKVSLRVDSGQPTTSFFVRLRSSKQVEVTVMEGRLRLVSPDRAISSTPEDSYRSGATITVGDLATISPAGIHLAKVGLDELNRRVAWTSGWLPFQDATPGKVAEEQNSRQAGIAR